MKFFLLLWTALHFVAFAAKQALQQAPEVFSLEASVGFSSEYKGFYSAQKNDFLSFDFVNNSQKPFLAWVFKKSKEKSCHLPLDLKNHRVFPEGFFDNILIPTLEGGFLTTPQGFETPSPLEEFFLNDTGVVFPGQALDLVQQARFFPLCREEQISFITDTVSEAVFSGQTQWSALSSGTYPAVCVSGVVMGLSAPVAREVGPLTGLFTLIVGARLVIYESMKKIRSLSQGQNSLRVSVALPLIGKSLATMLACSFLTDQLTTSFILYYFPHSQTKQMMRDASSSGKDSPEKDHVKNVKPSLKNPPDLLDKPSAFQQEINEDFSPPFPAEYLFPPLSGE